MAALLTPRSPGGEVDFESLERNAAFVLDRGLTGIVPCGGTGEYFDLTLEQRREIVARLAKTGRGCLIAGIGAASIDESAELARHAFEAGADAVLLPPPHFYRYEADALLQFYREAARKIDGPVLIYNLTSFVSSIPASVVVDLLRSEETLAGIKDSSGDTVVLSRLASEGIRGARIQGHDRRLAESLRGGWADATISGPASVAPEACKALFDLLGNGRLFDAAARRYAEFVAWIDHFPYPWALKWAAEWRGFGTARLAFEPSTEQLEARAEFQAWFEDWLEEIKSHARNHSGRSE